MDGVLVIDKPTGPTSHDVVAVARRALRERRIGHTGTLDPLASGVLPLVIGRATRLSNLLSSSDKEYEADVRLGAATPTYDAADRLASGAPPPPAPDVSSAEVEAVLERFRGNFDQVPPPYSAKKLAGVPAYKLARQDQAVDLAAVRVTVHALEQLSLADGVLRVRVRTSAGFYVRSLAHDIGVALGCGAHLEALRRTRAGEFGLDESVALDLLVEQPDCARERLIPMEALLPGIPAARLNEAGARRAAHGNPLGPADLDTPKKGTASVFDEERRQAPFRLVGPDGRLLGIALAGEDGALRPSIVLV